MPSFKIAVRKEEKNTAGECRIKVRLSHKGQTRYLSTSYYIDPSMVTESGSISDKYAGAAKLNLRLNTIVSGYMTRIIDLGDKIETMTGQQICDLLKTDPVPDADFFSYARDVISNLAATGHVSLADSYGYTLNHFQAALASDSLPFSQFNVQCLRSLETYLMTKEKRNGLNSIAVHLRNLRAIVNRAIDDETTTLANYPFRRFKIRTEETSIHNLSVESLKKLINARESIPGEGRFITPLHRTADLWLLSFYLLGINMADLVRLKKSDIVKGRLEYRRAKTHRLISVKIEPEARELIDRYAGEDLLLNFMEVKPRRKDERSTQAFSDLKSNANKRLKDLAKKLGIMEKIQMTSTRYTWSTIAASLDVTDSIIDRALGHKSPYKLVSVYTRFEISQVDKANRKVIDYLFS